MRLLDLTPDGIAALVERALEASAGGWSMGVQGALAEFAVVGDERAAVRRSGHGGRSVEAVTAGGGIRLTLVSTVSFTAGYAVNVHPHPGEGTGAFFFSLTSRNLFQ